MISEVDVELDVGLARMRAAKVRDELRALEDFRVFLQADRLSEVLLARVVTQLGSSTSVSAEQIASLSNADLEKLERAYCQLNDVPSTELEGPEIVGGDS